MFQISNLEKNSNVVVKEAGGPFQVIEHQKDFSLDYGEAFYAYFAKEMDIRTRQLLCHLNGQGAVTMQAGLMQWMVGDISVGSGVKGVGDLFGKLAKASVTKESAIKPQYEGRGVVATEPTYQHILLYSTKEWGGSVVLEDGLFLACESSLQQKINRRHSLSSTFLGNEGFFNLKLVGDGYFALESTYPKEELVEVTLEDDCLKIDGNMAIAWSASLQFTVERTTKTLVGSAASGEGFVNVYRGSGKVVMAPFQKVSGPAKKEKK